jgi:PBSX family phage terminase large subunit
MHFRPHSQKQQDAIFSNAKITACITGIQWGKSTVGAIWIKRHIHMNAARKWNFLVCAPTYKILEQATLPAFKSVMVGLGEYNGQKAVFQTAWGNNIYFRTATEPDSVVGITNIKAIWGDEAGKFNKYFWDNIQARAAFCDAPTMLTTSPYSLNWMFKELIQNTPNYVKIIAAESRENPYFPQDVWERRREQMDARRFNAIYGGKFERMQGLVYPFDDKSYIISEALFPEGTRYFCGVDWGYTNPCAMVVRAVTPHGMHYQVAEIYKTGLTSVERIQLAINLKHQWKIECFFCDPASPADIAAFNQYRCSSVAANNNIRAGIDAHYELMAAGRYKIIKGSSPYTCDEYDQYHYPEPEEISPDRPAKEQLPVKQSDHAMDANRYVTMGTRHIKEAGYTPDPLAKAMQLDEHSIRIAKLKRKKHHEDPL